MNGKIKTKFAALFAVALMITVCVVPMVGNDYGEAETVIVPSTGDEVKYIEVSGTVKNASGVGIAGALVTITSGNETVSAYTQYDGKYSGEVRWVKTTSASNTNITVTVVNTPKIKNAGGTEIDNPAYGLFTANNSVTFTAVTAEKITGVDFKAGYINIYGKVTYGNGVAYKGNESIVLYDRTGDTAPYTYTGISGASATISNGNYLISISSDTPFTGTPVLGMRVSSSVPTITNVVTIAGASVNADFSMTGVNAFVLKADAKTTGAPAGDLKITGTDIVIEAADTTQNVTLGSQFNKTIEYTYAAGKTTGSVTVSSEQKYGTDITVSNPTEVIFVFDKVIRGVVTLKNGANAPSLPIKGLTVTLYNGNNSAGKTGETDSEGKYAIWYGDAEFTSVKATNNSKDLTSNVVNKSADIAFTDSAYYLVSGSVIGQATGSGIKDVTIYNDSVAIAKTDANGKFSAYILNGGSVNIYADATYHYDVPAYVFYLNENRADLDFVMNEVELSVTVTDLVSNRPFKGVSVFYSTDYKKDDDAVTATWSKALVTDDTGKVKFKVNEIDHQKVYVYADYDGRSFTADEAKDAINFKPGSSWLKDVNINTNDVKYIVNFGVTDPLASGTTLPVIAEVEVTGVTYDIKDTYSLMMGDDGVTAYAYLTAPAPYVYYVYDADGRIGDYYVSIMTIVTTPTGGAYSSTTSLTLNEYIAKGLVQNQNGTAISEAKVTIYKGDVAIGNGVTNSVGYFEFPATQALTSATVEIDDVGYYTFKNSYTYNVPTGSTVPVYYANEYVGEGTIQDASGTPLENSKITVTSKANEDGPEFVSKVDADGEFKYLVYVTNPGLSATYSSSISAVDENGVYTFDEKDVTASTGYAYVANEKTYEIEVAEYGGMVPAEGVSVDLYQVKTNDAPVLIKSGLVTDEEGEIEIVLDASETYMALPKSVEYGLQFNKEPVSIDTMIVALNKYIDLELKSANAIGVLIDDAEYVVSSYIPSGAEYVKVGEATAVNGKVKIIGGERYKVSSPEGALYTFGSETVPYATIVSNVIKANEAIYKGDVTSDNGQPLEGIEVTLEDVDEKIVGTGVTDEEGAYEIVAIGAITAFAADAELDIGKFTFDADGVTIASYEADIEAEENLYSGYYANGAVVKDVEVSYMDDGVKSLAKVIDNKYYIVTESDLTDVKVTATAPNFNAVGTITAANAPLTVGDVPTYYAYFMPSMGAQILGPYNDVVYGTVLTLVAQNEYSIGVPEEDGVIQKYKFAGWYVNGDKVSDELIYAYTVEGDCTIYADYKVSSYVAAPADESNGLSMDVLVLGIVIVVLGLLAFAYAVKFKKE